MGGYEKEVSYLGIALTRTSILPSRRSDLMSWSSIEKIQVCSAATETIPHETWRRLTRTSTFLTPDANLAQKQSYRSNEMSDWDVYTFYRTATTDPQPPSEERLAGQQWETTQVIDNTFLVVLTPSDGGTCQLTLQLYSTNNAPGSTKLSLRDRGSRALLLVKVDAVRQLLLPVHPDVV